MCVKNAKDVSRLSLGKSISILYVLIEGVIMTEGLWLNYHCGTHSCNSHAILIGGIVVPAITALVWVAGTKIVLELGLRSDRRTRPPNSRRPVHYRLKSQPPKRINLLGIVVSFIMASVIVVAVITIGVYSFRFEVRK